jgi:hypothetical protein
MGTTKPTNTNTGERHEPPNESAGNKIDIHEIAKRLTLKDETDEQQQWSDFSVLNPTSADSWSDEVTDPTAEEAEECARQWRSLIEEQFPGVQVIECRDLPDEREQVEYHGSDVEAGCRGCCRILRFILGNWHQLLWEIVPDH